MRILIVDDHEVVREGLRILLQHISDIEVVAAAGSVQESIDTAKEKRSDVVIMDVRLADGGGGEAIPQPHSTGLSHSLWREA